MKCLKKSQTNDPKEIHAKEYKKPEQRNKNNSKYEWKFYQRSRDYKWKGEVCAASGAPQSEPVFAWWEL